MAESIAGQLIGIGAPTVTGLRAALMSRAEVDDGDYDAVGSLRQAGYTGGDAILAAFEKWVRDSPPANGASAGYGDGGMSASDLAITEFGARASEFFRDAGWGDLTFSSAEDDGVAVVDIANGWESAAATSEAVPGCHITTGMLAGFFARIAGYPVAVLETECCSTGSPRCRFMMGTEAVLNGKWEALG